jgi:hypothetical protein
MKKFKKLRQKTVLKRLTDQLVKGVKTGKKSFTKQIPLTSKDIKRIEKEIGTLTARLK